MSLKFVDTSGELVIPGAYPEWKVASATGGIATTGVITLVGEAEQGPAYHEEVPEFGPESFGAVQAKFGSGPLVDAYSRAVAASNDSQIRGAPTKVVLIKSNKSTKAERALGAYATLQAKTAGELGNYISVKVEVTAGVATVTVARTGTNTLEVFTCGGTTVLEVGYDGTAGSTFGYNAITKQVTLHAVGGTAAGDTSFSITGFPTLADLAAYIDSMPGWEARVASKLYGQQSPQSIDSGTVACDGAAGTFTAKVKRDAYEFVKAVGNSAVVQIKAGTTPPTTGIPAALALGYLSGGAKGPTLAADVTAALAAAERVRTNFVVPLFSRDATDDIADSLTDGSSTYTIEGVHAGLSSHVAKMSQFKTRRPRQGIASIKDTFANVKLAAQNLASARVSLAFQDYITTDAVGNVKQFQPWMEAVVAAGVQASGFYRPMFNKLIQCSGVVQAGFSGTQDFWEGDDSQVEDAMQNGLLVVRRRESGGFVFVSDQTTYGVDNNFVYNSMQAIYVADIVSQTVSTRMEDAFVGQNFADVPAAVALSYLKGVMADLRRLKLISASDDAPEGFRNAKIQVSPPAMLVSLEVKLATGVYFIPIKFLVSQVQQSAA